MNRFWSSAAYRIAFAYTAAFAFTIILLGTAVYFAADANFRSQQSAAIAAESDELEHAYLIGGLAELRANIERREADRIADAFGYAVYRADGQRIVGKLDAPRPAEGWHDIMFNDPTDGPSQAKAFGTALSHGGLLVVALDNKAVEQMDRAILMLFVGALALMILFGIGGAVYLGGYLRRRLERISEMARAILAGDLSQRVPTKAGGDEFDRVGRSLNAMLDRIGALLENLRQVSSDVAHDLRTPLTRLRSGIDAALDGPLDPVLQRDALNRALEQSDRLLSLFAATLRISEVEGGDVGRSFERVDVSALIDDLCESYTPVVQDGGRALICSSTPGLSVYGDRELLAQAIINLLDNAQLHTPRETSISIRTECVQDHVVIAVADDGPGVARADQSRILKRFVRLDASRGSPGNGLGLNLVAAIAAVHHGAIEVADNAPGLRVTIRLPSAG